MLREIGWIVPRTRIEEIFWAMKSHLQAELLSTAKLRQAFSRLGVEV